MSSFLSENALFQSCSISAVCKEIFGYGCGGFCHWFWSSQNAGGLEPGKFATYSCISFFSSNWDCMCSSRLPMWHSALMCCCEAPLRLNSMTKIKSRTLADARLLCWKCSRTDQGFQSSRSSAALLISTAIPFASIRHLHGGLLFLKPSSRVFFSHLLQYAVSQLRHLKVNSFQASPHLTHMPQYCCLSSVEKLSRQMHGGPSLRFFFSHSLQYAVAHL